MAGRLHSQFRSGNIAEHLGLLLLKGIAAVADVPRQEDVGLDAVASLLRKGDDGNLYAEDSFFVQLKSESKRTLKYRGHALSWLLDQELPMFIGRVSVKDAAISLYPTLHVNQAVLALHAKETSIRFGTFKYQYPWQSEGTDSAIVYLGEPVLKWSVNDLGDMAWSRNAYEVMKQFLLFARREYELLSLGQCSRLEWRTNDKESIRSSFSMLKGNPAELQSLVKKSEAVLRALFFRAVWMREPSGDSLMIPIILLAKGLKENGVDIDPERLFEKFFVALRKGPTDCKKS
jgi:hypothetical protein